MFFLGKLFPKILIMVLGILLKVETERVWVSCKTTNVCSLRIRED